MSDPLKLGLAGIGTVGTGLVQLIAARADTLAAKTGRPIEIVAVSARNKRKKRGADVSKMRFVSDPVALANDPEIDVFVELIGGEDGPAKAAVEAALQAGKHVVTANKALLAHHGPALAALAEKNGVALNFEGAVAGGIPVVKAIREGLQGNDITRVFGILNGTCNYILTKMEREGRDFADVLKEAQEQGYAEADPTFDVGGFDTAHKLSLLTSLAFGTKTRFDAVYVEGIETITPTDIEAATDLGYRIKLLGVALRTDSGIEQRVHPTMVPKDTAIANVDGVSNCVAIDGDFVGDVMLIGPGAGGGPTASAVMSDIIDIARGIVLRPFGVKATNLKAYKKAAMRAHEGGYYIRLSVYDRTGAFAAIAQRMAMQDISLESIVQRRPSSERPGEGRTPRKKGEPQASIVMVTHETTEAAVRKALAAIQKDGHVDSKPQMIRIEKL
ncbi:homoserine dehydrogenase [Methyloceanibacter caenitepidi]|uniref:Homoserine dehydrogenase n=1 Tax=Methyloceanibacter caenitepidi TaxID=1384459 RepID=A0A0A8K3E2_9HYPH|nr:homoserine dehydrogenase [Methyloceanibacter caenitepidi]BAQ17463.1 homoserine dehydrogenase [Methyloceanibacter caenitepidi]